MDEPVTLRQMLDARERRSFFRQRFFEDQKGQLLIQFTLNIPGEQKNSPLYREVFQEGIRAVKHSVPKALLLAETDDRKHTGPEGYFAILAEPDETKNLLSQIEETHPLGRLWDMDLFSAPDMAVSRRDKGGSGRRCLVCARPAHECARSKAHSLYLILEEIRILAANYFAQSSSHAV